MVSRLAAGHGAKEWGADIAESDVFRFFFASLAPPIQPRNTFPVFVLNLWEPHPSSKIRCAEITFVLD